MLDTHTAETEKREENTAFLQETPVEHIEAVQPERETLKQYPLRLPVSVITDLENEVKTRRMRGEMIEMQMYCRYVLEHHRKIEAYDTELHTLRQENTAYASRILEMRMHDENTTHTTETAILATTNSQRFEALQIAVQKASEIIAESSYHTPEYYQSIVAHYFKEILPQMEGNAL